MIHTSKQVFIKYSFLFILILAPLFNPLMADSIQCNNENTLALGIRLETEFWKLVQNQNIRKFSNKLATIFQGLNVNGIYTRDEQIAGLTGITPFSFEINNPIAKRSNDVLVFSYDFVAIGSDLTSGPSLTVWKKFKHTWKIVSHSYVPFVP